MKKRILLLSLIMMNIGQSIYSMEGELNQIADQTSASSAAQCNDENSLFLLLSDELKLKIIQEGIKCELVEEIDSNLIEEINSKSAYLLQNLVCEPRASSFEGAKSFIANLSQVDRNFYELCKDKEIVNYLFKIRKKINSLGVYRIHDLSDMDRVRLLIYLTNKINETKFSSDIFYRIVQIFQDAGIDLNQLVLEGDLQKTVLMLAVQNGKPDVVQALIKAGAQINVQEPRSGYTALMYAVMAQRPEMVQLLLNSGADKSLKNRHRNDALGLALIALNFYKEENNNIEQIDHMLKSHEMPQQQLLLDSSNQNLSNNNIEEKQ